MKTLLYIGNKLSKHGNNATAIESLGLFLEKESYTVFYASSKKNIIFRMLDMIYKVIKHHKIVDYVLIDTYSTINFWYAFIISQLCRLLSIKYIPILHGGNLPARIQNSRLMSNMIFSKAYKNVAPSNYLCDAFLNKGYSNTIFIPNSTEIKNYIFSIKKLDYPRLLWVRSFAKIYNPILAVKVLIKIKDKFPNATLCMVGPKKDDSFEETINFAKENNVEVIITGKLSKEKWISLSTEYNVFINTTHFDNTPFSVIEAMALGFPIISTNVGGIPYLLEHGKTGFLSPDDHVEAMVNNLEILFSDEIVTKKIISNAYEVVKTFDWEIIKKDWMEILE